MATKVKVTPLNLVDPTWSVAEAKPGDSVDLSVTIKTALTGAQYIELKVKGDHGVITSITKLNVAGKTYKGTWTVENTLGEKEIVFDAVLRDIPIPLNGHVTSLGKITSPKLKVHGFKVALKSVDDAFVPKQEKLHVKYDISGAPPKGRFEIWGERYPSGKPLYTEDFAPAAGTKTWDTWDGKANAGVLAGKYLTPEFSPYRVRVIIGVDAASVADPYGAGRGKVCVAEHAFEVAIEHLALRLQKGLAAATTTALNNFLKIEHNPHHKDGTFKAQGRLPEPGETCRLRVPCATHTLFNGALSSGGDLVTDPYMGQTWAGATDSTKWNRDALFHTRAELPLEVEPRLKSRDPAKNKAPGHGLFEPLACGGIRVEPRADEHYHESLYAGAGAIAKYLKNAAHKVKQGTHNVPVNSASKPVVSYWQARVKITAAGAQTIDLGALDPDYRYTAGMGELSIYKNGRTKLQSNIPAAKLEVEETDATHIKIKAGVAKVGDVLWIVRNTGAPPAGAAVAGWNKFPPGANCHVHYGGVRGSKANYLLLDDFTVPAPVAPKQPIVGSGSAWPYKASVNLTPDKPPAGTDEERVELTTFTSGANQGLAGVLFSPSFIAGDSYELSVALAPFPFDRTLGFLPDKPLLQAKTGVLEVWRIMTISQSLRMPNKGTNGMGATVGNPPDKAVGSRTHPGDGVHMSVSAMNAELEPVFNEWVLTAPAPPATDVHRDINLATYIGVHDAIVPPGAAAGQVIIGGVARVRNELVQFDAYRAQIPPNFPAGAMSTAALDAFIALKPTGTPSVDIMKGITAPMLGGAAGAIPVHPGPNASDYDDFVDGIVRTMRGRILDGLTTPVAGVALPVTSMSVVRWPHLYEIMYWDDGTPMGGGGLYDDQSRKPSFVTGFARGSGQSFFATVSGDEGTFPHEMGHTLHLVHFAAGNFEWKHHDLTFPQCKMSYDFTHGFIPQPAGAVGPVGVAAAEDTGWPDTVPFIMAGVPPVPTVNVPRGSPAPSNPPAGPAAPTIEITVEAKGARAAIPMDTFCAKCALKLRGWKDDLLPAAWRHPDLF